MWHFEQTRISVPYAMRVPVTYAHRTTWVTQGKIKNLYHFYYRQSIVIELSLNFFRRGRVRLIYCLFSSRMPL